ATTHLPLDAHGGYLFCYSSSLSILAGEGCRQLPLPANTPETEPLREFLALKRAEVTKEEFEDCTTWLRNNRSSTSSLRIGSLDSTRTLELRVGAFLWKIFGI